MSGSATLTRTTTLFMGTITSADIPAGTKVFVGTERHGRLHIAHRDARGLIYTGWVAAEHIDYGGQC